MWYEDDADGAENGSNHDSLTRKRVKQLISRAQTIGIRKKQKQKKKKRQQLYSNVSDIENISEPSKSYGNRKKRLRGITEEPGKWRCARAPPGRPKIPRRRFPRLGNVAVGQRCRIERSNKKSQCTRLPSVRPPQAAVPSRMCCWCVRSPYGLLSRRRHRRRRVAVVCVCAAQSFF